MSVMLKRKSMISMKGIQIVAHPMLNELKSSIIINRLFQNKIQAILMILLVNTFPLVIGIGRQLVSVSVNLYFRQNQYWYVIQRQIMLLHMQNMTPKTRLKSLLISIGF